jgi:hypothetical protein
MSVLCFDKYNQKIDDPHLTQFAKKILYGSLKSYEESYQRDRFG